MTPQTTPTWRCMAVVEIGNEVDGLDELMQADGPLYRWKAIDSPKGFVWYELQVDSAGSESRAARTAWSVLSALQRLADQDRLPDFRIVSGGEWLNMAPIDTQAADESRLPPL